MAENKVTKFPGVLDPDMNTELYLVVEEEITEAQFNTIKEGYGVTGPDFQIVEKGGNYFLKGDMEIEGVKEAGNVAMESKGLEPVFEDEEESEGGENAGGETGTNN
jgi:hypothetical protein